MKRKLAVRLALVATFLAATQARPQSGQRNQQAKRFRSADPARAERCRYRRQRADCPDQCRDERQAMAAGRRFAEAIDHDLPNRLAVPAGTGQRGIESRPVRRRCADLRERNQTRAGGTGRQESGYRPPSVKDPNRSDAHERRQRVPQTTQERSCDRGVHESRGDQSESRIGVLQYLRGAIQHRKYRRAALAACDKAIAADPNKADAYFIRGSLLFSNARWTRTESSCHHPAQSKRLQKYLELAPTGAHVADVKAMLDAAGVKH